MLARFFVVAAAAFLLTAGFLQSEAEARAGGGRSMGSRGSRSYSQPSRSYSQPARPQATPNQQASPAGGGFLRGMAGGIAGGLLGGMLFRSLGMAGGGMGGGGGIGLFEIVLIAGIGYLIYRMVKKRRDTEAYAQSAYGQAGSQQTYSLPPQGYAQLSTPETGSGDMEAGLSHIRQMDSSFDERRFEDGVMDIFFKIQGAWMNRDLAPVAALLSEEMRRTMQADVDRMLQEKRVNRLENIAVRNVDIIEAWQESGQDFITTLVYANLLDYTTDDATGQVVAGSKTDPVKFEEHWTFTRPVGNNPWRLSGIDQK